MVKRAPLWPVSLVLIACSSGGGAIAAPSPPPATPAPPETSTRAAPVAPELEEPAEPAEPIEPGPFLTADDAPLAPAREVVLAGTRAVIVPPAIATPERPGSYELHALTRERFVYLDEHRLAVIDGERGAVVGTRVLDETVERGWWTFSSDRAGRFLGYARSDGHVCVWDLDLDRVDCTPGQRGIVSPSGRSLFVETGTDPPVRLDLATARRHVLDAAPPGSDVHRRWAVSPSERRVVLASDPDRLIPGQVSVVWLADAASGAEVRRLDGARAPRDPFRPQGGTWVTWSEGFLAFRDTLTGALRRREAIPFEPRRMYWSPDGSSVIAYRYESRRGRAMRFDATTGEARGEVTMREIPSEWFTPGFREDGSFDFFEEDEVPSATGRTAARVGELVTRLRRTSRGDGHEADDAYLEDAYEEDTVLDAVTTSEGLLLVTPFGYARLATTGLTWATLGLFHLVDESDDDPPNSDGEEWLNYEYQQAGLLALGGGLFVERYGGTPYRATAGISPWPVPALPCEPVDGQPCCLASGSVDERSGRRVLRMLDRVVVFADPEGPASVSLELGCDEGCGTGEQCSGRECTRTTTDELGACMLRPSEEPRFDAAGRLMVTAGREGVVETFDVAGSRRLGRIARVRGEELPTQAFDIAADGSVVAFARGRNLHLHEITGARRGTVEARFARPVRFVRYLDASSLLVGLVDDSLHFVDATTLAMTSSITRPGFRADAPSRLASVLCHEGSLRWLEHRPGASADTARPIGRCDRDARMIVTSDLAFVVEVQGGHVTVHRVDDGRAITVSLGHHTTRANLEEGEPGRTDAWVIAMDDTGAIDRAPSTRLAGFTRRTGGVRSGALTPLGSTVPTPIVAAFMTPATPPTVASPLVTPEPTTAPTP